jgi:hypothetical protein
MVKKKKSGSRNHRDGRTTSKRQGGQPAAAAEGKLGQWCINREKRIGERGAGGADQKEERCRQHAFVVVVAAASSSSSNIQPLLSFLGQHRTSLVRGRCVQAIREMKMGI